LFIENEGQLAIERAADEPRPFNNYAQLPTTAE